MDINTGLYDVGMLYYNEGLKANDALKYNPSRFTYTKAIYHTVVDGENIWDLALKYYNSHSLWFIIAIYNRDKFINPLELPVGVELVFPDKSEVESFSY